jgi:flagellar basal-body rod protein FlgB
MNGLFSKTIDILSSQLGFRSERQKVLLSNVANIDTPDYQHKEVVFKQELQGVLNGGMGVDLVRTNQKHFSTNSLGDSALKVEDSGEQVSLDKEMINLAENHLMYNTTVELLARKFRGLKSAIQEVK